MLKTFIVVFVTADVWL